MSSHHTRISKFLSLVLRHEPHRAGVILDSAGWVDVELLLSGCEAAGVHITRADLDEVVAKNDKQRFAFNEDRSRIRANQGHSVAVELDYAAAEPPETLFHGTADRFLASIRANGLQKGQRHHVHLSADRNVAVEVGRRHGRPVVISVAAGAMYRSGSRFFVASNGVWLTDFVSPQFLTCESVQ